jgi:energy-coupling factor transporter ATP-binding protein EcfA2
MLTRLYIDNYRCFSNFEFKPARRSLVLGRNGSGKTSLIDALLAIRDFVAKGSNTEECFPLGQRTRWLTQATQRFELEVALNGGTYSYILVIEPTGEPPVPRVQSETLEFDGKRILELDSGRAKVYNEAFELVTLPLRLTSERSALAAFGRNVESRTLKQFIGWIEGLLCCRINPFAMKETTEGEARHPEVDLSNIVAWYRYLDWSHAHDLPKLRESLSSAIEDFKSLRLEPREGNVERLIAEFSQNAAARFRFTFSELSDGQRSLICLYVILHFGIAKGWTVIIDEPENFITLSEIQPWLTAVTDIVEEGHGQVLLISHHPELINQWAPSHGVQFVRDGMSSVRVEPFRDDPDSSLPPAELVARGWERG